MLNQGEQKIDNMRKLIILNGAINCGKSTIGKEIINKYQNIAFVELDDLRNCIPWMPIEKAFPLNIKNGIDISRNFIKENIDVILASPISDNDFLYLKSLIDFECEIYPITLFCELNENLKNKGSRILNGYEIERIKWMHANGYAKPTFSKVVDITDKSIHEVTITIVQELKWLECKRNQL